MSASKIRTATQSGLKSSTAKASPLPFSSRTPFRRSWLVNKWSMATCGRQRHNDVSGRRPQPPARSADGRYEHALNVPLRINAAERQESQQGGHNADGDQGADQRAVTAGKRGDHGADEGRRRPRAVRKGVDHSGHPSIYPSAKEFGRNAGSHQGHHSRARPEQGREQEDPKIGAIDREDRECQSSQTERGRRQSAAPQGPAEEYEHEPAGKLAEPHYTGRERGELEAASGVRSEWDELHDHDRPAVAAKREGSRQQPETQARDRRPGLACVVWLVLPDRRDGWCAQDAGVERDCDRAQQDGQDGQGSSPAKFHRQAAGQWREDET